jgi:predicted permease
MYVSANYFRLLGVTMARGRDFLPSEDDGTGQHPVVVVSHRMWQDRLGGDEDVIGRTITLNRAPYTVVGVAGEAFKGHRPLHAGLDLWAPLMQHPYLAGERDYSDDRHVQWLLVLGRLRAGATVDEATAALQTVFARLEEEYPETNQARGARAHPFGPIPAMGRAGSMIAVTSVLVLAGIILLIICGNLAGMVLARNATRDREIAVRLALGSGRGRLVRHLMIEALMLAIAGGGLGTLLAFSATDAASAVMSFDFPIPGISVRPNIAILAFTLLMTLGATLVFGLFPAIRFSRPDLISSLKDDTGSGGRRVGRIHRFAASAQTGVAFLFLVLCGLWVRAMGVMEHRDLGFEPADLLVTRMDLSLEGYESPEDGIAFLDRVTESVGSLPGVVSAAVADGIPLDQVGNYTSVSRAYRPDEPGGRVTVEFTRGTEGFLETIGTPVRQGRGFEATDVASSEPVAVVTSSLAQRIWPGEEAVGRQLSIRLGTDSARAYTVVGVVGHTASSRATEDWPHVFFALRQTYYPRIMLVIKGTVDATSLIRPVRAAILEADPGLPMPEFVTGESLVARATRDQRLNAGTAGGFGLLALILSAIGVYGVVAFAVASRTREIGLRMAMGASRERVLTGVLKDAVRLAVPGLVVGALLAIATGFSLQRFLLGVSPADPLSLAGAAAVLFLVVVLASVVPARRASGVDPIDALRQE